MFKLSLRLKLIKVVLLSGVVFGLIFGYPVWAHRFLGAASPDRVHTQASHLLTTITIPKTQDLFTPFLLTVPLHTAVTWRNDDTVTHVVTTTPQQNRFLNLQAFSFRIPAGKQLQITLGQAGLYHYYDTTMSTWNATLSRVAANRGAPHFPLAMDGVIWVLGPIKGLPTAAINPISAGHDNFTNEFLAISQPGGVTWHNFDADPHFVGLVSDWSTPFNPVDIGLYRIVGTDDIPGGASATVLFNMPGLYYYYCRNHSQIDPLTHRAQALPMASEYPIPMEGFVLVMGT
jgi:plastocyanin